MAKQMFIVDEFKKATFNKGTHPARTAVLIHLSRAYFFSTVADPGQTSDL